MSNLENILKEIDTLTQQIIDKKVSSESLSDVLKNYLHCCGDLAYTDPATIKNAQQILGRAIITHAYFASPVYKDKIKYEWLNDHCLEKTANSFLMTKKDLAIKDQWYTNTFESFDNQTSGTTGDRFTYKIWKDIYTIIETDCHYTMILKEFEIDDPRVLYMENVLPAQYKEIKCGLATIKIAEQEDITNEVAKTICSHGGFNDYAHISFDQNSFLYVFDYCRFVIDYIQKNKINVLMASGGFFELFTTFLISDDSAVFPKLVDLLSNTGDKVNTETLDFLKETGVAKNWCDHMRCWDGGASFFTCENCTFHAQDELAYLFNDDEGRLVSIDFFSYPSPFINYVNGDFCSISDDYQKCECGRWYREFVFHNRSPRHLHNNNGGYYTTEDVVNALRDKFKIGFFSVQDGSVSIEDSELTEEDKHNIIIEMSKIYVMVNFFKNPILSDRLRTMSGPYGGYGFDGDSCSAYCTAKGWAGGYDFTTGYCTCFLF